MRGFESTEYSRKVRGKLTRIRYVPSGAFSPKSSSTFRNLMIPDLYSDAEGPYLQHALRIQYRYSSDSTSNEQCPQSQSLK